MRKKWIIVIILSVVLCSLSLYCGLTVLAFESYGRQGFGLWPPGEERLLALAVGIGLGLIFGIFAVGWLRDTKKEDEPLDSRQKYYR